MGRAFVIEPSGKLAIFSSIVDDYIVTNATKEELIELLAQEAYVEEKKRVIEALDFEGKPEWHFNMYFKSYEDAERIRKAVHEHNEDEG